MKEQENKSFKIVEKVKSTEVLVHEVEDNAAIVNLLGWRMRVYFDKDFKGHIGNGQSINVEYYGDIDDPHSVRFVKLK